MTVTTKTLWPIKDISVEVVAPEVILMREADQLANLTGGILVGEVVDTSMTANVNECEISLEVIAPLLGNYRRRILTISHSADQYYPVKFRSAGDFARGVIPPPLPKDATSLSEFEEQLGNVLSSRHVISIIQSLIAQSNEVTARVVETADS